MLWANASVEYSDDIRDSVGDWHAIAVLLSPRIVADGDRSRFGFRVEPICGGEAFDTYMIMDHAMLGATRKAARCPMCVDAAKDQRLTVR